jgi:RNA polymerase sigma-70 factor (ECF subfamily)
MGRIVGRRISGHLLETLWNASELAIASNPISRIPRGTASCPIPENNFLRDLSSVYVVYTSGHVAMRPPKVSSGDCDDRASYSELLMLDDERVMRHLQAGNTDAFAVIFKRYHRLVHVTALHILRDAAEAEDLTQSVFLEIYRKAGQFDSARGTLKVWLLQHAYSRSANRRNYLLVRQVYNKADVSAVDEAASLWSPGRLQLQETSRLATEALASLPDAQRQTIEMFFFEGLDFKEIARRRNEKFSNVRHHYYRGLQRLRSYLEDGSQAEGARPAIAH